MLDEESPSGVRVTQPPLYVGNMGEDRSTQTDLGPRNCSWVVPALIGVSRTTFWHDDTHTD